MKKNTFSKAFGIIFLYYLLAVLLNGMVGAFNIQSDLVSSIILIIVNLLLSFLLIYIFKDVLKRHIMDFKKTYKDKLKYTFKTWGLGLLLIMVVNFIINVLILKSLAPNEEANREMLDALPLFSVVYMCLIGPFCEELLFRLNFKDLFKKKRTFILATGILFGAMHLIGSDMTLSNMLYLIPYSILGLTFSQIYYETDNIISSIVAHVMHNSLAILIVLMGI